MGGWANICHNLIICLTAPVTLHDSHSDRLFAKQWIDKIYDQKGIAFLGNVCAVFIFQLVLWLIGAEMNHLLTDSTQAGVVFSARGPMSSNNFWVIQCGQKHEHHKACTCHIPNHKICCAFLGGA